VQANRAEWIEACKETNEAISEAKADSWRDLLDGAGVRGDEEKMWKTIKSLNGTPDTNSPNEAMLHNGKTITDPKQKADIFAKHYANVSKLKMSKEDRAQNMAFKRRMEAPAVEDESANDSSRDIIMKELCAAIAKQKGKGAYGEDEIPPTFLKALQTKALTELLAIFNKSFRDADVPRLWRNAIIIPLLKAGKPASELASYRPVSLTSCIVKLLERILADRLHFLAETRGWFSKFQAGFRKGRSCEDQILRIVQAIEDLGFSPHPGLLDSKTPFATLTAWPGCDRGPQPAGQSVTG
jgi:hypothetical protein